ncbi:MAG: helix-turn-helix domain-containing protein [Mycobacterium kyogaense]|uniref:helix-turn-helix domain-containing protein n=1 Tax=Mycobacterium kyogaense TaxID=2212479 RepID=UPI002FFCBE94
MQMHNTSADDEIVSSEACKILQVDRATLLRWVADGQVAHTRKLPGRTGAFLFRRGDIQKLADKRATTKAEASA